MDKILFYSLNTLDGYKYLNDNYINLLYDYYVTGSKIFNYDVSITNDEFISVITLIDNNLKEIYSEEQIKVALIQFIQLLMSDARDNKKVDKKYFTKHLDYISLDLFNTSFLKKSKRRIKTLKKRL